MIYTVTLRLERLTFDHERKTVSIRYQCACSYSATGSIYNYWYCADHRNTKAIQDIKNYTKHVLGMAQYQNHHLIEAASCREEKEVKKRVNLNKAAPSF